MGPDCPGKALMGPDCPERPHLPPPGSSSVPAPPWPPRCEVAHPTLPSLGRAVPSPCPFAVLLRGAASARGPGLLRRPCYAGQAGSGWVGAPGLGPPASAPRPAALGFAASRRALPCLPSEPACFGPGGAEARSLRAPCF